MDWGLQILWWLAWIIPAILVFLVAVFVVLAPGLMLAGVVCRLYEVVGNKLRRRAHVETQLPVSVHAVLERGSAHDDGMKRVAEKQAAGKEV